MQADGVGFDAICFGGGSLQTVAYLAELEALERALGDKPANTAIRRFAGSSAGALYAISCACGMRSRDLRDAVTELCTIFTPSIACLWRTHGLDDCTAMDRILAGLLKTHGVDINMSIERFEAAYDVSLSIYAIDSETKRGVFMPSSCSLRQAFKCSAAIPVIFSPQYFENKMYFDGSFGNCWIPHMLPTTHRWLWLRVHAGDARASSAPPPPPLARRARASIEAYAMLVLEVARAPADIALEVAHVYTRNIETDARVPYIIPRMEPEAMRRVCETLPPACITFTHVVDAVDDAVEASSSSLVVSDPSNAEAYQR